MTYENAQQINNHINTVIHAAAAHAIKLRERLAKVRAQIETAPAAPSFAEHAINAARTGQDIDPSILDQIAAHAEQQRQAESKLQALASAHHQLTALPREVQRDTAPDTLAYLQGALRDYLEHVSTLDLTAFPTTAEQALTMKDGAKRWADTQQLLTTYATIREQQTRAYTAAGDNNAGIIARRSGQFRDAIDTERAWLDARAATAREHSKVERLGRAAIEFFTNAPNTRWEIIDSAFPKNADSIADRLAFIAWVAEHTDAWVPSIEELHHADNANRQQTTLSNWTDSGYRGPRVSASN